ncbi:hypothetical protein EYC84_002439 [Monilinia fructicola]|uniref:Uncharacterized protein n=1 Tax=Monilinia fructicola TaxID=38448 RepID=A0A5M9JN06_MONFR|nr:hypothetical protein EYC84_002439 [Monilinia fructicola]
MHTHTCIHTYIHTYIHTDRQTDIHTSRRTLRLSHITLEIEEWHGSQRAGSSRCDLATWEAVYISYASISLESREAILTIVFKSRIGICAWRLLLQLEVFCGNNFRVARIPIV